MGVEHTGQLSFERFCCSYKLLQDIQDELNNFTALATATAPCFNDVNITQNEQIVIVYNLLSNKRQLYNYSDCVVSIILKGHPFRRSDENRDL